MKRFIAAILIFAIVFCFTGCVVIEPLKNLLKFPDSSDAVEYPESDQYDNVLADGDGYFLVEKYEESYDYATTKFGIIDKDGNWKLELSDNNIFAEAYEKEEGNPTLNLGTTSLAYAYLGEGIFVASLGVDLLLPIEPFKTDIGSFEPVGRGGSNCYFYNINNKKEWIVSAKEIGLYENGVALATEYYSLPGHEVTDEKTWVFTIDDEGNTTDLNIEVTSDNAAISEGLFYCSGYFYDINGNAVIDISKYELVNENTYCFKDGKCKISILNPNDNQYNAVIDKNGDFVGEPERETLYGE